MTNIKIVFFIIFFTIDSTFAYTAKEGNVAATLGPFITRTNAKDIKSGAKSPYFGNLGLVVQGDVNDTGALEISLFHLQKMYFRSQDSKTISEKTEQMHITMGYRYWLNPYFSTALAFSSSYSMGDPQIIQSDFAAGSEIDTSAHDTTEYGFDFSIQSELWSRNSFSVVADARYNLSVTNKENEKGDHYGLQIGLKYLVQEKVKAKAKE